MSPLAQYEALSTLADETAAAMLANIEAEFAAHNRLPLLDTDRAIVLGVMRYGARVVLHEAARRQSDGVCISAAFDMARKYRNSFNDQQKKPRRKRPGNPPSPI